jgi:hypothetical protein
MYQQPYYLQRKMNESNPFSSLLQSGNISSQLCWKNLLVLGVVLLLIKFLLSNTSNSRNNQIHQKELIRQILRQQSVETFAPTLPAIPINPSVPNSVVSPPSAILPPSTATAGEHTQGDPVIVPPVYDPISKSVMSGIGIQRPKLESPWGSIYNKSKLQSKYYLDDGAKGTAGLNFNLCSKSCCSQQWPTPFKLKHDPILCANKDKFVPTNYMCNNAWQDSGCVCMRKKQGTHLNDRGGNG